jgi:hypothetical protein
MTTTRPLPVPDELTAPFWDAAARHELTLARCSRCAESTLPPGTVCPHCGSTDPDWEFVAVDGHGTVRSWTIVRQTFLPGLADEIPFVLVDVELAARPDVRLIGRLLDGVDAPLELGAAVRTTFEDLTPEVALPAFELDR